jgi:hypothetical protein
MLVVSKADASYEIVVGQSVIQTLRMKVTEYFPYEKEIIDLSRKYYDVEHAALDSPDNDKAEKKAENFQLKPM